MAVVEKNFSGTEYQEPESNSYIYHPLADKLGLVILEANGFRVCAIHGQEVTLEPTQEGVLRYPPVQVDVDRSQEYIKEYIQMGPSTFSDPSNT